MRDIRFRAWNKELGSMHPVATPQDGDMQFTGLLDREGVEIYEGDIIERHNGEVGTVYYSPPTFDIRRDWNVSDWEFVEWPDELFVGCEVIGNVYENKRTGGKE